MPKLLDQENPKQQVYKPTNAHKVRQFCGLVLCFKKFVQGHAELTKSLTQLMRKYAKLDWGQEQRELFAKIKEVLTARPLLMPYVPLKNQRRR